MVAKTPSGLPVLNAMAVQIKIGGITVGNSLLPDTVNLPEKDRPVLAAAIHHHCGILVTGDRTHFGQLYGKSFIASDASGSCIGLEKRFEHDPVSVQDLTPRSLANRIAI